MHRIVAVCFLASLASEGGGREPGRVFAVNGSAYFNRPGPRIVVGLQILAEIIHPEIFPRTTPPEAWQRLP